jgi:transcription initiation factor IIE alpha subunit
MVVKAVESGVAEERIAHALNIDVTSVRRRLRLLDGICQEAATGVPRIL